MTLAVSKRKGANAVQVAQRVLELVEEERGMITPADVSVQVARNYGATAAEKSNELLSHMGIAIVSITLLLAFVLGWREASIVAIPVTLSQRLCLRSRSIAGAESDPLWAAKRLTCSVTHT